MSTPRICDKCNTIFSENLEGWTSAAGARRVRNSDGKLITQEIAMDYCPACSEDIAGGNSQMEPSVPSVRGRYDARYTRQLEKEAGIDSSMGNVRGHVTPSDSDIRGNID